MKIFATYDKVAMQNYSMRRFGRKALTCYRVLLAHKTCEYKYKFPQGASEKIQSSSASRIFCVLISFDAFSICTTTSAISLY